MKNKVLLSTMVILLLFTIELVEIASASFLLKNYSHGNFMEKTRDVLVVGNYLYMANMYFGMRVVDISDIQNPNSIYQYFPGGGRSAVEMERYGNSLILADRDGGVKLFDIENPASPLLVSHIPAKDKSSRLALKGHLLFIAERLAGVFVYDISDPLNPIQIGLHEHPRESQGISVNNNYAYVANPWGGFYVLDVTSPSNMKEISYYNKPVGTQPGIWDIGVRGAYAYLLCQQYGVQIVDISNPYSPNLIHEILLPNGRDIYGDDSPPLDLEFIGKNHVAISNGFDGVYIVNIVDPSKSFVAEHIKTRGFANGLRVKGDILFIADGYNGVQIQNISEFAATIYEDAEDEKTSGWMIYDNDPGNSRIFSVFDLEKNSHVIGFYGKGQLNGYALRNIDISKWDNTYQFFIEWSMKYSEPFTVYIDVQTTRGQRFLTYKPLNYDGLGDDRYIYYGLGSDAINNKWITIRRNIIEDLQLAQPGNQLIKIDGFLIRGSGFVDDIILDRNNLSNKIYENGEDGSNSRWYIYDDDPYGSSIINVFDNEKNSRVIEFASHGLANGFALKGADRFQWYDKNKQWFQWSMKFSEYFTLYVEVATNHGKKFLTYKPFKTQESTTGFYVYHYLGKISMDGAWLKVERNLLDDLRQKFPGASIHGVNGFYIRGSGRIDDIMLLD